MADEYDKAYQEKRKDMRKRTSISFPKELEARLKEVQKEKGFKTRQKALLYLLNRGFKKDPPKP